MNVTTLLFPAKLHQLREEKQLYQKQIADALSIDTPMYCRIERGERRAKREQITVIAKLFQIDETELVTHWLADKLVATIGTETELAPKAFEVVLQKVKGK